MGFLLSELWVFGEGKCDEDEDGDGDKMLEEMWERGYGEWKGKERVEKKE